MRLGKITCGRLGIVITIIQDFEPWESKECHSQLSKLHDIEKLGVMQMISHETICITAAPLLLRPGGYALRWRMTYGGTHQHALHVSTHVNKYEEWLTMFTCNSCTEFATLKLQC